MDSDLPLLKKGAFYHIRDGGDFLIMEDRTKRGLEVRGRSLDEGLGVESDFGMIHDMDGIGHKMPIRWYFPKADHSLDDVLIRASEMEDRYTRMRELTCPDD